MSAKLRCLVIGSGSIAKRHIKNLKLLMPEYIVGCLSSSGRILKDSETGADKLFNDFQEAIAWQPEMAIVASPSPFHIDHALALLEHGIPTLIEKPLSDSLASVTQRLSNIEDYRERIEVGYNLRYLSSAKRMKEIIDKSVYGRIHSINIDMGQYLPSWRPATDYRLNVSARKELGGGVLLELSHEFDYLTWLFGKFDISYCIVSNSGWLEIDVEDRADIMFSRADGLVAYLHMDFLQLKATRCCKVITEAGNILWDLITNTISLETEGGVTTIFAEPDVERNQMYIEQLEHFIAMVKGDARPKIGFESAYYTLKMIEALKKSSATGSPVSIKEL